MDTLLEYGLIAVFVALLLAPVGLPIPEDVTLLAAGALIGLGQATWLEALGVAYVGVLIADSTIWFMGRRIGLHPTGWIARVVGADQIERIERFYRKYGAWTIAIARQIPGIRFPSFFFAGATGISWPRFLLFQATSAFVNVNVYLWLGRTFADDMGRVVTWIGRFREIVGVAVVILVAFVALRLWRARHPPPTDGEPG